MERLIDVLAGLPPLLVLLVAAVLVFAETGVIIGLVLPGELTLIFVGFLVFTGTLNPAAAVVVMIVAALTGDGVAFAEGRRTGNKLRTGWLGRRVGDERWQKATDQLNRLGGRAEFVARYIAFARTLMPRLAGASGLPYRRFVPWDVLGVTTQVAASIAVGYLAGTSYQRVAAMLGRATGAVLLFILVVVALVIFGRYIGRNPDPVTAFGNRLRRWRVLRALDNAYDAVFRWLTARTGVTGAVVLTILLGVGLILAFGLGLAWSISALVSTSGLPLVDNPAMAWIETQRTPDLVHTAETLLSWLRGSVVVGIAGVVGLLLNLRRPQLVGDVLGVLGALGAFLPLLLLAVVADWILPDVGPVSGTRMLFPTQVALVTASLAMVAWQLTRRWHNWSFRVAAWFVTIGIVLVVGAARFYLGWSRPSELLASTLLGALWVLVFAVAWRTRDRVQAEQAHQ